MITLGQQNLGIENAQDIQSEEFQQKTLYRKSKSSGNLQKEKKKVRKQENKKSTKKAIKKKRKQELDQESDQENKKTRTRPRKR